MPARAVLALVLVGTLDACFADPLHGSDSLESVESDRIVVRLHDVRAPQQPARASVDAGASDAGLDPDAQVSVQGGARASPQRSAHSDRRRRECARPRRDPARQRRGRRARHALPRPTAFRLSREGLQRFRRARHSQHGRLCRTVAERARWHCPDARCVTQSTQLVLAPLPVPYDVSPSDYIADLNTTESIARVFHALGDDAAYPLYFHCYAYGRDRTGVLAALILLALGASRDAIMREYLISQPTVGAYPDSLDAVLSEIERRGGISAYLSAAAITSGEVATLRAHAIAR